MIIKKEESIDGITTKYLMRTYCDKSTEVTFVDRPEKDIICFSSSIGCSIGCNFCSASLHEYDRVLSASEMEGQIKCVLQDRELKVNKPILFSCMGEGEPFLNIKNILIVFNRVKQNYNAKFSLSTTLRVPYGTHGRFLEGFRFIHPLKIQISVTLGHNAEQLMYYVDLLRSKGIDIEFNYVLIKDCNDSVDKAVEFCDIYEEYKHKVDIKINAYNYVKGLKYERSTNQIAFLNILRKTFPDVEYYETDGRDINAACGQLSYKENNKEG